jgi:hypothetical protein
MIRMLPPLRSSRAGLGELLWRCLGRWSEGKATVILGERRGCAQPVIRRGVL